MPRKNKEEYNEYMRNYVKKARQEKSGKPVFDGDFDPSSASGKPVLNINKTSDLIKQTEDLLRNKGSETETDPILKAIDKYGKYVPLVMQFIQGLQGSMKDYNKKDLTPKIQPPEGWLNMSPMQKLNYKYSRSEWYEAGERYDAAIESGYMNPQINASYVDPTYTAPAPQDLRSLARKYPEPPLASNTAPINTPVETPVNEKSGDQRPVQQVNGNQSANIENSEKAVSQENQIVAELQQDNLKYINLGAEFINRLSDKEFKDHLKNIEALIEKAKPFIPLIPIQVKGMIIQTSKEDLETLFKEKCPEKYAMVVKSKKVKELLELFEKLKTSVK
jgi:hypothetical protein